MPETNVLYSVTAAVVFGLLAWVGVVLKSAKEPWARPELPAERTGDDVAPGDASAAAESDKGDADEKSAESDKGDADEKSAESDKGDADEKAADEVAADETSADVEPKEDKV